MVASLEEAFSTLLWGETEETLVVVFSSLSTVSCFFFLVSMGGHCQRFLSERSQYLENVVLSVTSGTRNAVWSELCCAVDWEEITGPGRVGTRTEQF